MTCDDEVSSVVQVMVAVVAVIAVAVTAEMTGGGVNVANEELADVPVSDEPLVEATSKS